MNFLIRTLRQESWFFLFFAFIALLPLVPMASNLFIPNEKDFYNHVAAIIQAKSALAEGQFPLRVAPFEQFGWRYPFYQFYSPTSYTFAALIYKFLTPDNPFVALKITLWTALLIGGIYIRRLALWFTGSNAVSLLTGVVYLTAPYCAIAIGRIGGFNEGIAFGVIPPVIYYTLKRYFDPSEKKFLLQTALCWYLLATIHMVTFVYTSLFTAILILFISFNKPQALYRMINTGIAYGFAFLMAMWFLGPILLLQKHLVINVTFSDAITFYNDYSPNLLSLISPIANFLIKMENMVGTVRPSIGIPIVMSALIAIYVFFHRDELSTPQYKEWMLPLLGVFLIAFILVWSPFNFWIWLPDSLRIGQYSWRILSQVMWIGALLFACAMSWLFKDGLDIRHVIIGSFLIIVASSSWLTMLDKPLYPVANIIKNPHLIFGEGSYLINTQRTTQYVDNVDNLILDTLMPNKELKFNFPYYISPKLLDYAQDPYVLVKGSVPFVKGKDNKIIAYLNHSLLSEYALKTGNFEWKISLKKFQHLSTNDMLKLQFKNAGSFFANKTNVVKIDKILLTGFLNPHEVISVEKSKTLCHQVRTETICEVRVPSHVRLVELPILYYPHLIKVTLNDKVVSPQSILYRYLTIVGITPLPGQQNKIKVEFTGLSWANRVSLIGWALWGLVLLHVLFKMSIESRRKSR